MSGHGSGAGGSRKWETSDANARPMIWLAVGLTIMCIVAFGVCKMVIGVMDTERLEAEGPAHPMSEFAETPSGPMLQDGFTRVADLVEYRATMEKLTTEYGWIEPAQGIVSLPLERAAELMLKEKQFKHRETSQQ